MLSFVGDAQWTDRDLEAMRALGDEAADTAIRLWTEYAPNVPVHQLAQHLVGFEHATEIDRLIDLLSMRPGMATAIDPRLRRNECTCEADVLDRGQALFAEHGLKILMVLVFYSLPSAYAAMNGVRVLHSRNGSTGFFVKDLNRRLIETTQFVIDVMTPGGLHIAPEGSSANHGQAVRSALRVRLLHAAVRSLIESHGPPPWDGRRLGTPVNQEDMAGTLLTFSWVVLDGLRKLDLGVSPGQEVAYFEIWKKVGLLLGVRPQLIPDDLASAKRLMCEIKRRQIDQPIAEKRLNGDGIDMTHRLLAFTRAALPFPLRLFSRLPASVMRFFLPPEVANSLRVPRTYGLDEFVRIWFFIEGHITKYRFYDALNKAVFKEWGGRDPRARSLLQLSRFFNKRLVHHIQCFDRNQPLDVRRREPNVLLRGMEQTWGFDQADFLTRGARQIGRGAKVMTRRRQP